MVQHSDLGGCALMMLGFPATVLDHFSETIGGLVVPSNESCFLPLDSLELLNVGPDVRVP